jgi:hypothetical protein
MTARSIETIQAQLLTALVAKAAAVGITIVPAEMSAYDYRLLLTYMAAVGDNSLEQLWVAYMADVNAIVAAAAPQTGPWFQQQMYLFQFDATTPQVLQFNTTNFTVGYPTVNAAKRVIKYCSVVPGIFGTTTIKVAAQVAGAPADLDTAFAGALAAAQSYVNILAVPGLIYNVQSGNSDKIYIDADIYYQGGYSAVIQERVEAAITAYLGGIPFNGTVLLSSLEVAIRAVTGVNDIVVNNVQARADATSYGSGTDLVVGNTVVSRRWATVAGYIVPETATGHTLADSLTYIAE